jgi:hypothetical protein
MNWMETIFHFSPDGGTGALEVTLTLGAVAAVAGVLAWRARRRPAAARRRAHDQV